MEHPTVKTLADKATNTFALAFELFGKCHRGYNSSHMTHEDIDELGKNKFYKFVLINSCIHYKLVESNISNFLKFYRENFTSASILPKMRITLPKKKKQKKQKKQ